MSTSGLPIALASVAALAVAATWRRRGSAARRSFAQRLTEFGRASVLLPPAEGEWSHPIYGKQVLTLLAYAYPVEAFRRLVAYAVEASDRGLVQLPIDPPPVPPKRLWPELDAAYALERGKPLVFRRVDTIGMADGISVYIGSGRYDRVEVGHIALMSSSALNSACGADFDTLRRTYGSAPVFEVASSGIRYALLRNKGIGRKLYDALIDDLRLRHPSGFYLVPNRCGFGATSPDADRVWGALRRRYPHHGLVLFVPSEAT